MIDTYKQVRGGLSKWRFMEGRKGKNSWEPMYCAFAATPFRGDDWFILRLVKEGPKPFAIGFCPDYGDQGLSGSIAYPATARRSEIRRELLNIIQSFHLTVPEPKIPKKVHAYKGFELKLSQMQSAKELANLFIHIVLEWEKLFETIV